MCVMNQMQLVKSDDNQGPLLWQGLTFSELLPVAPFVGLVHPVQAQATPRRSNISDTLPEPSE